MNDAGPPHVMENSPGHKHNVQKKETNRTRLHTSTDLLTFEILRALLMCCYVWQCWLISTIILELNQGYSVTYVIILGALQYTMLIFGFPSLCKLWQYRRNNVTNRYNYKPLILLLFSTFTIP